MNQPWKPSKAESIVAYSLLAFAVVLAIGTAAALAVTLLANKPLLLASIFAVGLSIYVIRKVLTNALTRMSVKQRSLIVTARLLTFVVIIVAAAVAFFTDSPFAGPVIWGSWWLVLALPDVPKNMLSESPVTPSRGTTSETTTDDK